VLLSLGHYLQTDSEGLSSTVPGSEFQTAGTKMTGVSVILQCTVKMCHRQTQQLRHWQTAQHLTHTRTLKALQQCPGFSQPNAWHRLQCSHNGLIGCRQLWSQSQLILTWRHLYVHLQANTDNKHTNFSTGIQLVYSRYTVTTYQNMPLTIKVTVISIMRSILSAINSFSSPCCKYRIIYQIHSLSILLCRRFVAFPFYL